MDTAQLIVTLLGAGGGGAVLLALVNGLIKYFNGYAGRERTRNTSVEAQRRDAIVDREAAETRADLEAEKRRRAQDEVARLRHLLILNGISPGESAIERTQL